MAFRTLGTNAPTRSTKGRRCERAILSWLKQGTSERFDLPDEALPALHTVLRSSLGAAYVVGEVERVLALSVALEKTLDSPTAGAKLRALLRAHPKAVAFMRNHYNAVSPIEEARGFLRSEPRQAAGG